MENQTKYRDIPGHNPYGRKKKKAAVKKVMSVMEMGKTLGLKKTDSYWLVHKGYFGSKTAAGKMWVDIASFEKWYANQVKYCKVDGEEPGKELKRWTYSPKEIAQILGISEDTVYTLLKKDEIGTVMVDYQKRIPKEAFWKWYESQEHYRNEKDREKDEELKGRTVSMPEMAGLLGMTRDQVYCLMKRKDYKHFFECVTIAGQRRITKDSFERFLQAQGKYGMPAADTPPTGDLEAEAIDKKRKDELLKKDLLTRAEAAELAGVSVAAISRWVKKGYFPVRDSGRIFRIPCREFIQWNEKRMQKGGK